VFCGGGGWGGSKKHVWLAAVQISQIRVWLLGHVTVMHRQHAPRPRDPPKSFKPHLVFTRKVQSGWEGPELFSIARPGGNVVLEEASTSGMDALEDGLAISLRRMGATLDSAFALITSGVTGSNWDPQVRHLPPPPPFPSPSPWPTTCASEPYIDTNEPNRERERFTSSPTFLGGNTPATVG